MKFSEFVRIHIAHKAILSNWGRPVILDVAGGLGNFWMGGGGSLQK